MGKSMKPLVTKKYIFKRKLDGKPIVVELMTKEQRERYPATQRLFFECGIFEKIQADSHGRNTRLTHIIHSILPRNGQRYLHEVAPIVFTNDAGYLP